MRLWVKSRIARTRGQPRWCFEKGLPGEIGETVGIAIAAAEQVDEHIIRQIVDVVLEGTFGNRIGQAAVIDFEFGGNGRQAWRCCDAGAGIAERIGVAPGLDRPVEAQHLFRQEIHPAGRVDVEDQQHGRFMLAFIADVEACTYLHGGVVPSVG